MVLYICQLVNLYRSSINFFKIVHSFSLLVAIAESALIFVTDSLPECHHRQLHGRGCGYCCCRHGCCHRCCVLLQVSSSSLPQAMWEGHSQVSLPCMLACEHRYVCVCIYVNVCVCVGGVVASDSIGRLTG